MREKWADITKGLAIWMMVFCHANLSHEGLLNFIYIFHMPVFFLISGYFDKGEPLSSISIKKSFHSLIRPYFIYSLLGLLFCWISPYLHPEIYKEISSSFASIYRAAFIGMFLMEDSVTSFSFMPSGPLWFLVALFFVKFIWQAIICAYEKRSVVYALLLLISIIAIIHYQPSFFSLDSALLALPFYILGSALKHLKILESLFTYRWCVFLFIFISLFYLLLFGWLNGHVDIDGFNYGNNIGFFYLNGVVGSICLICVSSLFEHYDIFVYKMGQASLSILGLHLFFCILGKIVAVALFKVDAALFPVFASLVLACLTCSLVVKLKSISWFSWLP